MSPEARAPLGIALVGPGRAGRARIAALEGRTDAELRAVVRREPALGEPCFEDVLRAPGIDAVLVCTPNLLHARAVSEALDAGKHVLVEFPLAASPEHARELFARARSVGRVLHVEHVELLSASQRAQRARLPALGALRGGSLEFRAGLEGWIGDASLAGSPALRAVARLHRLLDLFGRAQLVDAALTQADPGYRLEVRLRFAAGGSASLVEERAPGLSRQTRWALELERGILHDPPSESAGGIFGADLEVFLERVRTGGESYVSEARILEVLTLVTAIEARVGADH